MMYHPDNYVPAADEVRVTDIAPEFAGRWLLCTDDEFRPAENCWFTPKGQE